MKRNRVLSGLTVLLGIVVVSYNSPHESALNASAFTLPFTACEIQCWDGPAMLCEEGEHYAFDNEEYRDAMRRGGSHTDGNCYTGSCLDQHDKGLCNPIMGGDEPLTHLDLEALRLAVRNNDVLGIREVLNSRPARMAINRDRSAIQVVGCTGDIIVHMPISASVLSDLDSQSPTLAKH